MCEIGVGVLSCAVQDSHIKKGFEMDYQYNWHKKGMLKEGEIMLKDVDWWMLHNWGSCLSTMKLREPEYYQKLMVGKGSA